MTGFGRAEAALANVGSAVVEIQTLNHRFLEAECRFPDGFQWLEEPIRQRVGRAIRRGRVKVSIHWRDKAPGATPRFQPEVARRYVAQLKTFQRRTGIPGAVTLEAVLGLPQVVSAEKNHEELPRPWGLAIQRAVGQALDRVLRMRCQEGRRLRKELTRLAQQLTLLAGRVRRRVPAVTRTQEMRLARRIRETARRAGFGEALDPKVVTREIAAFVQGTDISEELARIASHLTALRQAIGGGSHSPEGSSQRRQGPLGESPGRTIDFLAQELHREVNTLGAKMRDPEATGWVVAMKSQIESIREQAANIE